MASEFEGLHIVVTGGTGSLGAAVCRRLLNAGARISIPCYDKSELSRIDFADNSRVFIPAGIDLSEEKAAESFYEDAVERQGSLWASVHIAGGFGMGAIEDTAFEDFEKQLSLNAYTCFNSCRQAVRCIRNANRKEGKGGRIVNIASRPALEPRQGAGMTAYTVSKAAVAALTQSLAAEVAGEDILVNAVAPSVIDTPANRKAMPGADFDTWPKPEEIAAQIEYLVSPGNTVTRGAVIPVYGKA